MLTSSKSVKIENFLTKYPLIMIEPSLFLFNFQKKKNSGGFRGTKSADIFSIFITKIGYDVTMSDVRPKKVPLFSPTVDILAESYPGWHE